MPNLFRNSLLAFLTVVGWASAQTTGPTRDQYGNMVGEVELLKYILQPNTRVNLAGYKDYMTWGGPYRGCFDPVNTGKTNQTAYYTTKKIMTKMGMHAIQHCHGSSSDNSEGLVNVGSTAFTWHDGQLHPKSASASRMGFYTHHYIRHFIPVVAGQRVSARFWLATAAPSLAANPRTGIRIVYFDGWDGKGTEPNVSKVNSYEFAWENNTTIADHAYTLNFNPPFTGTIGIDVGPEMVSDVVSNGGALWLKAMTLQDGQSNGIVPASSYTPARFEPRFYLKFRNSGLVMLPDFGAVLDGEENPDLPPGLNVKQVTQKSGDVNQQWYIHPSNRAGFYNLWTKHGALASGPYWWEAWSRTIPDLGDPWQQVQFLDQGNGYSRIRMAAKGPAGEDLYLTSYNNDEGAKVAVYFGGVGYQDVQVIQAQAPIPGVKYRVQYVHSNKCLAIANGNTANGAAVIQQTCSGATSQQLTLSSIAGGYYSLTFAHSGKLIDINGGSTADGAAAIQWPYNGGNNQQFTLYDHNDGTFSFAYRHSGKCLDINGNSTADGAAAIQWPCHWNNNQRFRFVP